MRRERMAQCVAAYMLGYAGRARGLLDRPAENVVKDMPLDPEHIALLCSQSYSVCVVSQL